MCRAVSLPLPSYLYRTLHDAVWSIPWGISLTLDYSNTIVSNTQTDKDWLYSIHSYTCVQQNVDHVGDLLSVNVFAWRARSTRSNPQNTVRWSNDSQSPLHPYVRHITTFFRSTSFSSTPVISYCMLETTRVAGEHLAVGKYCSICNFVYISARHQGNRWRLFYLNFLA